jgi:hypothetical protein
MKRKVYCNKQACSLDRLPDQQFGGGLRVQSPDYVIPISRTTNRSVKTPQVGKGKARRKRSVRKPLSKGSNKPSCLRKKSISRRRAATKKRHVK